MIGFLKGTVLRASEKEILLETPTGVGYVVFPAGSLLAKAKKGEILSAEVVTIVREQEISLYGFGDLDEKKLFEKLISVSGIGPKTALGMVSTPVDQFMNSVEQGDVAFLTKMPGIGKKTAERLIVELRGKIDLSPELAKGSSLTASKSEAIAALESLGYDRRSVTEFLSKAPTGLTTEEYVKKYLSASF
ncbi:Holliday junction branch migration protein RuvA [bacterium DOLZORAL124_38_8]|nr:MAG: Holliday junction branch migration protein RuvA [bacterium DOLZORAL124_38_8]